MMVLAKVDQSPISLLFGALPIGQFAVNKPDGAPRSKQAHHARGGGRDVTISIENIKAIYQQDLGDSDDDP